MHRKPKHLFSNVNSFFCGLVQKVLFWSICGLILFACKPRNEIYTDNPASLFFSDDAIIFDTIVAGVPVASKRLKVYNPNSQAVQIRKIFLGGGNNDDYEIIINAQKSEIFENVSILGRDSLLVIISARIRNRNQDEIYQAYDSLMFELTNQTQNVKLLTWAENVNVVSGVLPCNAIWTKQRPYLLKGNVEVPLGCTLTIQPATKIYAFNDAKMEIKGSLKVNGKADSNAVFRYFRREAGFENLLGAWQGLRLRKSSTNNQIRFAKITNAKVAVFVDSSEVLLEGATLQSASEATLAGVNAKIFMRNCLLNNAILRLFQAANGGEYELVHCTLANYEFFFNRQEEAGSVFFNETGAGEMQVRLFNNIFWGNLRDEILFAGENINLSAANNIFRTQTFRDVLNVNNNLLNVPADSLFRSPRRFDYRLPSTSPAIGKGIATSITTDILGKTRKNPPDIGAFER